LQPACFRYATAPGLPGEANDASAVTTTIGIPCRCFSFLAGSSCNRYGCTPASVGVTTRVLISDGSETGGSYATGIDERPQMFGPANGDPAPSMQTIPFTRFGRASATSHPNGPPAECVITIDGPILSR